MPDRDHDSGTGSSCRRRESENKLCAPRRDGSDIGGPPLPHVSEQASEAFSQHVLEHLLVQGQVGYQLLEPTVLVFEIFKRRGSATPIPLNCSFHR